MLILVGNKFSAPFFQNRFPLFGPFQSGLLRKWPHISPRRMNFQKSPRTIVVLRWVWRINGFVTSLSQNGEACFFSGKCPKLGKNRLFSQKKNKALLFWLGEVTKPIYSPDPLQNYNSTLAFLKFPPSGRDMGPFP